MTAKEIRDFCEVEAAEGKTPEEILYKLLRIEGVENPKEFLEEARKKGTS